MDGVGVQDIIKLRNKRTAYDLMKGDKPEVIVMFIGYI